MEQSLCTQTLPPAQPHLALAPTPQGTRAVQGSRVFREQNKFSASRDRLSSQVRRAEGEGKCVKHHHSPNRSCSWAKPTVPGESGWHVAPPHPAAVVRSCAVSWSSRTSTPSPPPQTKNNNPQHFKRLLKFIRFHCRSLR